MTLNPSNPSQRLSFLGNGFLSPTNNYNHQIHLACTTHSQTSQYVCIHKECTNRLLCYECYSEHTEAHRKSVCTYKEVMGVDIIEEIDEEINLNAQHDQKKELCMAFLGQLQGSLNEICKRIEKSMEIMFLKIKEKVLSTITEPLFPTSEWEIYKKALTEKKNIALRSNNGELQRYLNNYLEVYSKVTIALSDSDNLRGLSVPQDTGEEADEALSVDPEMIDEAILNLRRAINKLYSKISSQLAPVNTPADNIEEAINNSKHYKSSMATFHLSPFYSKPAKPVHNNFYVAGSNASIASPNKEKLEKTLSGPFTTENFLQKNFDTEDLASKKLPPFLYDEHFGSELLDLPYVGPMKMPDGSVYKGQMKSNRLHGKGKKYWKDGRIYEGYFKNDQMEGKGRMTHPDQDVYEGQWQNGVAQGKGIYRRADGWVYEGDWVNDQPHGMGVETWPDMTKYEGEYRNGLKDGKGFLKCADGSFYRGTFRENMFDGQGIYGYADGRRYDGEWSSNLREGQGIQSWPDGRKYNGAFVNDKKHGFGTFEWKNGRKYMGYWKDDKPHGQGRLSSPGEDILEGEWKDGKLGNLATITAKDLRTVRENAARKSVDVGKSVDLMSDLSRQSVDKTTYRGNDTQSGAVTNYSVKSVVVDGLGERKKAARTDLKILLKQKSDYADMYGKDGTMMGTPWMSPDMKKNKSYQIQVNEKNNA